METLIVSRTIAGQLRCIGGIVLDTNQSVRLVQENGYYWPVDCDMQVGQIWDITFTPVQNLVPPFLENVIVHRRTYLRNIDARTTLLQREQQLANIFWRGPINILYHGHVSFQTSNGVAYIEEGNEPQMSTGFWVPDRNLILQADGIHFSYGGQTIKFKGEGVPPQNIPVGTLCRVSLGAKWHPPFADWTGGDRYYLQLSGWY